MTPVDYYQHHRTHILTNIARSGDVIHYKNNQAQANKIVGCAFKNYILFNVIWDIYLSGITCLPFPEQACIQLVTGPLHCRNCGKAFFLSQMRAKLQTPAMESGDGKFCGCADGD